MARVSSSCNSFSNFCLQLPSTASLDTPLSRSRLSNGPRDSSQQLKCSNKSTIAKRNARLAEALGINPVDRETVAALAPPTAPPLQIDELMEALTPPAVPSLNYAKSLASALSAVGTDSPTPHLSLFQPILATLCSLESPTTLQTAGFNVLSAFFTDVPWSKELWESRTKALSALIRSGSQTIGMEDLTYLDTRLVALGPTYLSTLLPLLSRALADRKSTRLNSSHSGESRMPSSA